MGIATADSIHTMVAGEVSNVSVSFDKKLPSGDTLAISSIVEITSSDLTLSNKVASTSALTIEGNTVATGRAAQVMVDTSGVTFNNNERNKDYRIRFTVTHGAGATAGTKYGDVIVRVLKKGEN